LELIYQRIIQNWVVKNGQVLFQGISKSGEVVLDSNWSCAHDSRNDNCYDGNEWSLDLLLDPEACSKNCYFDRADYTGTYAIQRG
jgi:hypothetical protein